MTRETGAQSGRIDVPEDVSALIEQVQPTKRQRDARTMLGVMIRATGLAPYRSGSIIGFGHYRYRYESGREGDAPAAGFAPRKAATVVYLMDGVGSHADDLAVLGQHRTGVGCLYLTDLSRIDLDVLERVIAKSFATLSADTYRLRAREG